MDMKITKRTSVVAVLAVCVLTVSAICGYVRRHVGEHSRVVVVPVRTVTSVQPVKDRMAFIIQMATLNGEEIAYTQVMERHMSSSQIATKARGIKRELAAVKWNGL